MSLDKPGGVPMSGLYVPDDWADHDVNDEPDRAPVVVALLVVLLLGILLGAGVVAVVWL